MSDKVLSSTQNHEKDQIAVSSAGTIMIPETELTQPTSSDNELIKFDKVSLSIPKRDILKHWSKLQKYMEIYLEDYEELKQELEKVENIESEED